MSEEQFSPEESLQLIQNMIAKTRRDMGDNSSHFLLWGWITFIACTGQFILKHVLEYPKHYLVWWIIVPGVFASIYLGMKEGKKQRVETYIGESMKYLWMGMGISYFVLSMILSKMGWNTNVFPFFILLYGLGTFVSGQFLQFRPLIWGGVTAWALAITSAYFSYDYQALFAAGAIMVSYIIPAYMLKSKVEQVNNA
ncbi:MAG: hypothetical protein JST86_04610 [Bacteroidetes bacterium]|nr:hypothetical protein [Bacteroidota bacterium]